MLKRSVAVILPLCLVLIMLAACGSGPVGSATPTASSTVSSATATPGTTPTVAPSATRVPLRLTSIDMAVTPSSIAGMACGTSINVFYTATFHAVPNSVGGTVQFLYTVNNGRSSPLGSVTFAPGETTKTFTFNWAGVLAPDNVYPGLGGVITTSPNVINSPVVRPTGTCVLSGPFTVTGIDLTVNPNSIAGRTCGSSINLTYTATFHIAPGGPGGTIQFSYTFNNGRSQTPASVIVAPGETLKTYTFTSSGTLYPDHTFPGNTIVMATSPNTILSPGAQPAGMCS